MVDSTDFLTAMIEVMPLERRWSARALANLRAALRRYWKVQSARAVNALNATSRLLKESEEDDVVSSIAASKAAEELSKAVREIAGVAISQGVADGAAESLLELSFSLRHPMAADYIERAGADLVTRIDETTRESLRTLLKEATENGWSYGKTSREIRRMFNGFAGRSPLRHIRDRGELVVTTEIGNAYSEGKLIFGQDMEARGLRMEKRWITVGDDRVDQNECSPNAGQGWIPLSREFQSGHARPLAHPGCRCAMIMRSAP